MESEARFLDGNAVAGELAGLFGQDITAASGKCLGCGHMSMLAEAHAFVGGPGIVLRCPSCASVVLRLVRSPSNVWLDTKGLAFLQLPSSS
jgi:hypothetical protein